MKFEFSTNPDGSDIEFLTEKINEETTQYGKAYNFGLFLHDENNTIIGGCNGSIIFGAIYTDQLWVDKKHRGTGLGKKIMEEVHSYGKEIGCTMATLGTMSFQNAKGFYEKLGYEVDFERGGYLQGGSMIIMRKNL